MKTFTQLYTVSGFKVKPTLDRVLVRFTRDEGAEIARNVLKKNGNELNQLVRGERALKIETLLLAQKKNCWDKFF